MIPAASLLKQLCDRLLDDQSTWVERKQCLENMHELFVEVGALDVQDENLRLAPAALVGGVAIAPTWAGMCLFDIARTRQFVLGLKQAITDQLLKHENEPVQVLDAGCGPYGLLSLLCAFYFTPRQVQFSVLDIFPANIESTRTLINELQMEDYFSSLVVADAPTYTWPSETALHILVTETMNMALWKEPQVAIILHLSPQLAEGGVLIPTTIEVSLLRQYPQKTNELPTYDEGRELTTSERCEEILALIISLHKDSTYADISKRPLVTVSLPTEYHAQHDRLLLSTDITIYKEIKLHSNESAITLPKTIKIEYNHSYNEERTLSFYYKMDNEPGIHQHLS